MHADSLYNIRESLLKFTAHPRCKNLLPSRVTYNKEVKTIDRTNIIETKQRKTSQVLTLHQSRTQVLWLFGQRMGTSRDSGIMEFLIPENMGIRSFCACLTLKRKWNVPTWQPSKKYPALEVFEKAKADRFLHVIKETWFFFKENWCSLVSC